MTDLDRLGWAAGTAFRAYGQRIGVRVSERSLIPELEAIAPPQREPLAEPRVRRLYSVIRGGEDGRRRGVRRFHLVYAQSQRLSRTADLAEALADLERDLERYLAEQSRRLLFVHAGVVGWHGRAILVPGHSHSGKSTLVAALLERGASYLSDEYALVDARGRVHAYPRPLSLREAGEHWPRRRGLRLEASPPPLRAGLVVLTRFEPGASWRPRRLGPGQAVLGLLRHTVPARRDPARVLARLARLVGSARIVRGVRGEAGDAARRILELAGSGEELRRA